MHLLAQAFISSSFYYRNSMKIEAPQVFIHIQFSHHQSVFRAWSRTYRIVQCTNTGWFKETFYLQDNRLVYVLHVIFERFFHQKDVDIAIWHRTDTKHERMLLIAKGKGFKKLINLCLTNFWFIKRHFIIKWFKCSSRKVSLSFHSFYSYRFDQIELNAQSEEEKGLSKTSWSILLRA